MADDDGRDLGLVLLQLEHSPHNPNVQDARVKTSSLAVSLLSSSMTLVMAQMHCCSVTDRRQCRRLNGRGMDAVYGTARQVAVFNT